MDTFTQGLLTAFIPSVLISILTAYITVRLSMKQFYSQKWWEKKADAYSKIIEELSYLQYYYGEMFDNGIQNKDFDDEEFEELEKKYKSSKQMIMQVYASGSYIISEKSVEALKVLVKELDIVKHNCSYIENFDRWYGATKDCIDIIRVEANKELKK